MTPYKHLLTLKVLICLLIISTTNATTINQPDDCGLIFNNTDYYALDELKRAGKYKEIYPSKRSLEYSLPYKHDRSTEKAFPPIGKQKGPVCASYSSTYYNASYVYAKREGIDLSKDSSIALSPYYVYAMAEQSGKGIGGTSLLTPMEVMIFHGTLTHNEWSMSEKNYQKRWNTSPALWRKALSRRMKMAFAVYNADTPEGVNEIKKLLLDTTCAITVGGPDSKRGFRMRPLKTNPKAPENSKYPGETGCIWSTMGLGGHAMALVGYNDSIWLDVNDNNKIDNGEMGAWKIANSYGEEFPEIPSNKGFHWISYDATRKASIVEGLDTKGEERTTVFLGNKVEGFQIMPKDYEPKVLVEITIKTAGRMDPRLTFFKTTTSDTPPFNNTNSWQTFVFGTKAGSQTNRIGFDAENYDTNPSSAPEGTFSFDITEHAPSSYNTPWRLGISIVDKYEEKTTEIKSIKVIYLSDYGDIIFTSKNTPLTFDNNTKNAWVDIPGDETAKTIISPKTKSINFSFSVQNQKSGSVKFKIINTEYSSAQFEIFDMSGRALFQKNLTAGTKTVEWKPKNRSAKNLLLCKLSSEYGSVIKKFSIIK